MAKRISQLDAAGPLTGIEVIPIVQDSRTKKVTIDTVKDYSDTSCQCTLVNRFAQVGNDANTLEQFLHTYQMPADTLSAAGSYIEILARGEFATNNNIKIVNIYFGSTSFQLQTTGADGNNKGWEFNVRVSRMTQTTQEMTGSIVVAPRSSFGSISGTVFSKGSPTENLSTQITVQMSVQTDTASANDILVNDFIIVLHQLDANT